MRRVPQNGGRICQVQTVQRRCRYLDLQMIESDIRNVEESNKLEVFSEIEGYLWCGNFKEISSQEMLWWKLPVNHVDFHNVRKAGSISTTSNINNNLLLDTNELIESVNILNFVQSPPPIQFPALTLAKLVLLSKKDLL